MKALVLAGGFPQIALVEELKKRGIEVILADYNENPVAKEYADSFYQVSTLDIPAITEVAKIEKVDFLITACTDQALLTVACVSEKLGLPCYIDYETALNVTNKSYMKAMFEAHGIPSAKHVIMAELEEDKISGMEYPLIVKPVDCNSSKGVKRADNIDELRDAFSEAVRLSRTDTAIVEEFIEGPELTADVYIENGVAHLLSLSNNEKIADKDKFIIFRTKYPAAVSDDICEQVRICAQKIAEAFGIKNAPMLVQLITDGRRIFVIEFSARTGGGVKYLLAKKASGFDVISAVVDLTLGIYPHVDKKATVSKYIANEFIYCNPGKFDRLEGFDELKAEGVIADYYIFKWQGAEFNGVNSSGDRVGGFTVQGNTAEEIEEKHRIAASRIKVLDADGNDIMRHELLTDLHYEI
ncbi:MAG: ATP-grasp domain-containing protein [Ruminococcaceae bacterium]|nr:ATP-grasp domain-containing protein [Oscillospiraceae bacterium]